MRVVDARRSMIGERFARARSSRWTIVKEMDRRDSFVLLACDTSCRAAMDGIASPRSRWRPAPPRPRDVERFLATIEPDGGGGLAASDELGARGGGLGAREKLRVIYLGDGTPSAGPTRASHLEDGRARRAAPGDGAVDRGRARLDAGTASLRRLARGGGGAGRTSPGRRCPAAALSAVRGVRRRPRDPKIELPQASRR